MKQVSLQAGTLFIALFLIGSISIAAGDYVPKSLTGKYAVYGSTLIDPDLAKPQDSNFYFFLEGEPARDMYIAMKEKPVIDACRDDGSLSKTSGNIACVETPEKTYECSFSINLATQAVEGGLAC